MIFFSKIYNHILDKKNIFFLLKTKESFFVKDKRNSTSLKADIQGLKNLSKKKYLNIKGLRFFNVKKEKLRNYRS